MQASMRLSRPGLRSAVGLPSLLFTTCPVADHKKPACPRLDGGRNLMAAPLPRSSSCRDSSLATPNVRLVLSVAVMCCPLRPPWCAALGPVVPHRPSEPCRCVPGLLLGRTAGNGWPLSWDTPLHFHPDPELQAADLPRNWAAGAQKVLGASLVEPVPRVAPQKSYSEPTSCATL